jgi:uncharacterized damage-inducible protein DinB
MTWADSLRAMAGYNRWMNEKLYDVCERLPDEERKRDRSAFFKSIHGTLNHLLLADRAWLGRFTGRPVHYPKLDLELYADFAELRRERRRMDDAIEAYCATLTDASLASELVYRNFQGKEFRHALGVAVVHLFNHQTHHRGQVTTLLSQAGIDPGVTDSIAYYRQTIGQG